MDVIILILGMAAVTYLPRSLPMFLAKFESLGFLKYLPVAIFSSLVFTDIFVSNGSLALGPKTLAGFVAFAVAWRTKNVIATMLAGVIILFLLNLL